MNNIQMSYLLWQIVTQPCFSRSTFWLGLLCKIEDDLNSSSPPHLLGKCFLRNFFRSSASIFEAATALWPRGGRGGAGQKWSTLQHSAFSKRSFLTDSCGSKPWNARPKEMAFEEKEQMLHLTRRQK